jgi:hypothetical protein
MGLFTPYQYSNLHQYANWAYTYVHVDRDDHTNTTAFANNIIRFK